MRKTDENEFHAFVASRMDRWRRSAYMLCGDWYTADDLVSTTVGKLFRHWRTVSRADNPDAYAQRVLTRCWLDERRRPWRREQPDAVVPDAVVPVDTRVEDRQSLLAMLDALGPRQRAVLVLRFYLDMSVEETADILQIQPGTVKSQSARGLSILRALAPITPITPGGTQ